MARRGSKRSTIVCENTATSPSSWMASPSIPNWSCIAYFRSSKLLVQAGVICELEFHRHFYLHVNKITIGYYES